MSACLQCGVEVIQATFAQGGRVVLDAKPHPDGTHAAWLHREGLGWIWRTRHHTEGDRLSNDRLRRVHACTPADEQLDLGAA